MAVDYNPDGPYVVWTYEDADGWSPRSAPSFEDAVGLRDEHMGYGYSEREVVITKRVVLKIEEVEEKNGR